MFALSLFHSGPSVSLKLYNCVFSCEHSAHKMEIILKKDFISLLDVKSSTWFLRNKCCVVFG